MRTLYNILFIVFFCLSAPWYFFKMWRRGNWRAGFSQRFGNYEDLRPSDPKRKTIWLHAVSVGEVNICAQVIRELRQRAPDLRVIVSTTTTTGMAMLNKMLPEGVEKIYYPIDRRRFVRRAFEAIRPDAIVLVEAEIWPNFLWQAQDRKIPLFLINARISDRSYPRYLKFGFLFRSLFAGFTGVGVQDKEDAAKVQNIGCRPEAVHVFGNLKFDAVKLPSTRPVDVPALLRSLGVADHAPVLVAGSTFAGEERMLAEITLRLRAKFPGLFLVLVPRHFERARQAGADVAATGARVAYRSELNVGAQSAPCDCLIVDTTGELVCFYEYATLAYVGKSLTPVAIGGQNPIEPAALSKPMLFGPNMQNFAAIAQSLLKNDAAIQVKDAAELEREMALLLANPQRREQMGVNGRNYIERNFGSIKRSVEMILAQMPQEAQR